MTDNSSPKKYEQDLIRHIAGKALVESERIDTTDVDTETIETALWAASGEVSFGMYVTDPDDRDLYKHRQGDVSE